MAFFRTKPRDEQLSFLTECVRCRGELSISNGRVNPHDCEPHPITLAQLREVIERQIHG